MPTVLIVDDQQSARETLRSILADYTLVEAVDGKDALNKLSRHAVDLMLLDLDLPRIPGLKVVERLAETHPLLPVIIVSGTGHIPDAIQAARHGVYDYVEKPIKADILRTLVDGILKWTVLLRARQLPVVQPPHG